MKRAECGQHGRTSVTLDCHRRVRSQLVKPILADGAIPPDGFTSLTRSVPCPQGLGQQQQASGVIDRKLAQHSGAPGLGLG